ncbi:MAG TPA: hypothetical protein VHC45_09505 [Gaiellaceae bacterium]|nr:hypothetical protein [Gaiellaceae bacterium]
MRPIQAEVLKLVRRRALMIWSALLTVGSVVIVYAVLVILHAVNGTKHGPAGGVHKLEHVMLLLSGLGGVAGIIIGSTAGSQDVSAGVFRDLVVTGRPRSQLFNVRFPGALLVYLPMLAVGFGLGILGSYAFAGSEPTASAGTVGHWALYVGLDGIAEVALAVGIAAFVSSRIVVGVLIAWNAIVSQILISIGSLGGVRKAIDVAAFQHFAPQGAIDDKLTFSTGLALLVIAVWVGVALAAGRRWTQRIDA